MTGKTVFVVLFENGVMGVLTNKKKVLEFLEEQFLEVRTGTNPRIVEKSEYKDGTFGDKELPLNYNRLNISFRKGFRIEIIFENIDTPIHVEKQYLNPNG